MNDKLTPDHEVFGNVEWRDVPDIVVELRPDETIVIGPTPIPGHPWYRFCLVPMPLMSDQDMEPEVRQTIRDYNVQAYELSQAQDPGTLDLAGLPPDDVQRLAELGRIIANSLPTLLAGRVARISEETGEPAGWLDVRIGPVLKRALLEAYRGMFAAFQVGLPAVGEWIPFQILSEFAADHFRHLDEA